MSLPINIARPLQTLASSRVAARPESNGRPAPFGDFLNKYRDTLRRAFHVDGDFDKLSLRRGLPPHVWRQVMACNPLSACIPAKYGGRGGHIHESTAVLAASSYESLALSLALGINWALFLQPLAKYGREEIKGSIFGRFLQEQNMGGLMITEPDFGTDALSMQTSFRESESHYHVQGVKHWGGLTGLANFWLVAARRRKGDSALQRDIDFFVCDVSRPGQEIEVEEYFENLGLYLIPYGRNRIDIQVPKTQRLQPATSGIKMMLDLLHRSRMEFPGMGMGFLKRLLDEGLAHCKKRFVGGRSLFKYDQVQERLARLQAGFTVCSAMCTHGSRATSLDHDLSGRGVEANAVKSVLTDIMHDAAQSLLQLVGASGYRLDHVAGRGAVDSRSFQIFEGSNDILYSQISEAFFKLMRRAKETNLFQFLQSYSLTERAAEYFRDVLNFEVNLQLPQRKLVELGRVLGRIISMELVIRLGDLGFRGDLISGCLLMQRQEIAGLLQSHAFAHGTLVVDGYEEGASWLQMVS